MITCPECGFEAPDDARFCDKCGRGLAKTSASPAPSKSRPLPLEPGTVVGAGFEVVALIGQDSIENRYRAIRRVDSREEKFRLRERAAQERPADAEPAGPQ